MQCVETSSDLLDLFATGVSFRAKSLPSSTRRGRFEVPSPINSFSGDTFKGYFVNAYGDIPE